VSGLENYVINYTYDGNNCIGYKINHHSVTTDHVTYSHDANGNLLSETTNTGETTTYRYNRFNQLIGTSSASGILSYSYNAKGIRTGKQSNLSCISYLLDGGQVAAELSGNTVTSVYLYGANRISRIRSHSTDYYLYNAHGDVVQLTNTSGAVTKTYEYDAFGNESVKDIYDGNPFRYCGEYYDIETWTYYLRARYYDPVNGRFTQPDTWEGDYSDPLSLNKYTYCYNNPIQYIDPTGNAAEDITRLMAHAIIANPLFVQATQQGAFPNLFKLAGFIRDDDGIYHARQDAIQQIGGYNDLYDTVFYYGTSMDAAKFDFVCGDRSYILWAWKGDYLNLGAGAELGIYSNKSGLAGKIPLSSPIDDHWLVDTSLAMSMSLTLNDRNGNELFHYAPEEKQWWITGFDPYLQNVQASDLTATYTITFNGQSMYNSFFKKYGDRNSDYFDPSWSFNANSLTAKFKF
jgi:RHS repeat-associated protein